MIVAPRDYDRWLDPAASPPFDLLRPYPADEMRVWNAPHGALCAALLPHGMAANVAALRARAPLHPSLERYAGLARLLTGRKDATAEEGVAWVRALCADINIPALRAWGIAPTDLPAMVEKAACASSMQATPLPLTSEEQLAVLSAAW